MYTPSPLPCQSKTTRVVSWPEDGAPSPPIVWVTGGSVPYVSARANLISGWLLQSGGGLMEHFHTVQTPSVHMPLLSVTALIWLPSSDWVWGRGVCNKNKALQIGFTLQMQSFLWWKTAVAEAFAPANPQTLFELFCSVTPPPPLPPSCITPISRFILIHNVVWFCGLLRLERTSNTPHFHTPTHEDKVQKKVS